MTAALLAMAADAAMMGQTDTKGEPVIFRMLAVLESTADSVLDAGGDEMDRSVVALTDSSQPEAKRAKRAAVAKARQHEKVDGSTGAAAQHAALPAVDGHGHPEQEGTLLEIMRRRQEQRRVEGRREDQLRERRQEEERRRKERRREDRRREEMLREEMLREDQRLVHQQSQQQMMTMMIMMMTLH